MNGIWVEQFTTKITLNAVKRELGCANNDGGGKRGIHGEDMDAGTEQMRPLPTTKYVGPGRQ